MSAERYDFRQHGGPIGRHLKNGTLLDCRGDLYIHPTAQLGPRIEIITVGHYFGEDCAEEHLYLGVRIDERAYIGTGAKLYNCWIQHHAVVGMGAVVKSVVVPAYTMVDGNPAMIIAEYDADKKRYIKCEPYWPERWKHE
jgi:acetyltransferase-like isoleucine patch superfamily enzyme